MPRETVTIELSKLAPYEAAAQLFAVIAYPYSQKDRVRFSDAICGWMLGQFIAANDQEWEPTSQARYWRALVKGPNVELAKGFRVINRERLIAAKMAAPGLEEFRQFMTQRRQPGWAPRPTSDEVIEAVSADLHHPKRPATRGRKGDGGGNRENIISRHWTPSKPVLHLCLSLHLNIHALSPNREDLHLGDFLPSKDTIAGIIGLAGGFSEAMRLFNIEPEELIEVIAA
jgi:hypothetical protein